jgi:arginine decarboxylase
VSVYDGDGTVTRTRRAERRPRSRPVGWSRTKSAELYHIDLWGNGFFAINEAGRVEVRPERSRGSDLFELTESVRRRGLAAPVLFRFDQIVRTRVRDMYENFAAAIAEANYRGSYRLAYPIKVNQHYHVVESVRLCGTDTPLALEVGSKPELLGVIAIHDEPGALLICNGYKDSEYIELALMARKIGRRPIIVIEQLDELDLVLAIASKLGTDVELGIRMKPTSKGAGRWDQSAGDRAKFGLASWQIQQVAERLHAAGRADWLKMLHFHVGSQITAISAVMRVMREASRVYTEIAKLCPSMTMFNAGGGLGVDYDGSSTAFHSSMNYTIGEYAQAIVYALLERCDETGIPHPDIVTESGRAIMAHHALLVVEATDVSPAVEPLDEMPSDDQSPGLIGELVELHDDLTIRNCRETLHEAIAMREEILEQFIRGDLTLAERATAERILRQVVARIHGLTSDLRRPLEELADLANELNDLYFCNFSIFQSIPDSWALDQVFPVMPIQRLDEKPTRRAILVDLTCDSDGRLDRFIDERGTRNSIRLHPLRPDEPYYLGIFLVGAYQEILGDLHNLFGDTNAVHVNLDEEGNPVLSELVRGDSLQQALQYVQYDTNDLFRRLSRACDRAIRAGLMSERDARDMERRYREAMSGYTYLIKEDDVD